jgi:hypothetical protein
MLSAAAPQLWRCYEESAVLISCSGEEGSSRGAGREVEVACERCERGEAASGLEGGKGGKIQQQDLLKEWKDTSGKIFAKIEWKDTSKNPTSAFRV